MNCKSNSRQLLAKRIVKKNVLVEFSCERCRKFSHNCIVAVDWSKCVNCIKDKKRVIYELTKRFEISLIVLVKNLRKRWRRIVWNLNSKNVLLKSTTACFAKAARSLKKKIEKFFVWTSCNIISTSARELLLLKILIFLICWIIWIQIKKVSWFNILLILSIFWLRSPFPVLTLSFFESFEFFSLPADALSFLSSKKWIK